MIGFSQGTIKCDACNMPTPRFVNVKVTDDEQGKFIDERWCLVCFYRHGDEKHETEEQSR
ncbi:MAG: hypothetical protein GEU26_17885 [Nitrososphaeraceae archaeon]|nr:hypothetical protein [Nitrososphaeraceae archaeon]